MSVLRIGGVRMAVGLEWERGRVEGADARRIARQRRRPLAVDVVGQTGFLDEAEGAAGTKPLAGVLATLLQGRQEAEDWIAFVEEDEDAETGPERRLAVVRSYGSVLLPDGDAVYWSLEQALEALGDSGGENVLVVATADLAERFGEELPVKVGEVIDVQAIVRTSDDVDALVALPTSGWSRKRIKRTAALAAIVSVGLVGWSNQAELKRLVRGEEGEAGTAKGQGRRRDRAVSLLLPGRTRAAGIVSGRLRPR